MSEALEKFKAEYIESRPEFSTEEVIAAENAIESAWHAALEQPSTAEIRASALEKVADDMAKSRYAALYRPAIRLLRVRAKRIREEG